MTKKSRTILFFICLFLFLTVSPLAILYSQGYRFDFSPESDGRIITKTGGFFVKVQPRQAEIYINDQLKEKTDFLFGSAFIKNLLPKKYKFTIKKEGFLSWEKTLEVREKSVTEAKSITLFSDNIPFTFLYEGVKKFWLFSDGKKIITEEKDSAKPENWALKIYDLEKNVKSQLITEGSIYSKGAELINLEFSKNQLEVYLTVGLKEQLKSFSLDLSKATPVLKEKATTTAPNNVIAYQKNDNEIFYLDDMGFVFSGDANFLAKEKLNSQAFPIKQETEYKIEVFSDYVFLWEGKTIYLLNAQTESFEKLIEQAEGLKISPDGQKIAYFSDSEIWILFLREILEQPPKKAGEKTFLARFSEKINDLVWLNPDYLAFSAGNKIKISEIDNRDKLNIYDIGEFANPNIIFSSTDNKLYLLSEEKLYSSVPLLP
jgi:hypothetical protein